MYFTSDRNEDARTKRDGFGYVRKHDGKYLVFWPRRPDVVIGGFLD